MMPSLSDRGLGADLRTRTWARIGPILPNAEPDMIRAFRASNSERPHRGPRTRLGAPDRVARAQIRREPAHLFMQPREDTIEGNSLAQPLRHVLQRLVDDNPCRRRPHAATSATRSSRVMSSAVDGQGHPSISRLVRLEDDVAGGATDIGGELSRAV